MRMCRANWQSAAWLRDDPMFSIHTHHPVTQRLALIAGIAVFVVIVFGDSFASMWDLWQTSDHRHGLLVFPISAFLIWRVRHQLADVPIVVHATGLLLVIPLALAWIVARLAGIQVAEHFVVLAMIPAVVATLAGPEKAGKLLFPLLFLMLATPIGDSLIPYLMVITADISTGLLQISGFPVLRNGQYISLPGGEFVVADVCAGLRYLVAGVMISLLYGYLTYTNVKKRVVLVAVTAVTLIVANGVRAYIVMAVASATRMQYLGGRDHIYFGWLLFGVVMTLIMWIGARYADEDDSEITDHSDTVAIRASHTALPIIGALGLVMLAVTLKPVSGDVGETGVMIAAAVALFVFVFLLMRQKNGDSHSASDRSNAAVFRFSRGRALTAIATLAILILTPRFAATVESTAVDSVDDLDFRVLVDCTVTGPWQQRWQPRFQEADLERSATLACAGGQVSVFVAAYASALQGKELVSSSHHVIPPRWDRISTVSTHTIRDRNGKDRRVMEVQVDSPAYRAVVWYWYEVDGHVATGELMTKAYQLLALARGRPAGGRVVVVESSASDGIQQARARLRLVASTVIGAGDHAAPGSPD